MRVRHPAAGDSDGVPPTQVDVAGAKRPVDDDGVVTAPPDVARRLAAAWADRFDVDADDLLAETCDAVKSDGEVCGRDLPCPYHSED